MTALKRNQHKRLVRAGWRTGDADDFLELSEEEVAYLELRLLLGESVRRLRTRTGLTQASFADRLGSSQSRVAKIEAGDPGVSLDLQVKAILALGTSRRELARIIGSTKPRAAARAG